MGGDCVGVIAWVGVSVIAWVRKRVCGWGCLDRYNKVCVCVLGSRTCTCRLVLCGGLIMGVGMELCA